MKLNTDREYKIFESQSYSFRNNYIAYIEPLEFSVINPKCRIVLNNKGKKIIGKTIYLQAEAEKKIRDMYLDFFLTRGNRAIKEVNIVEPKKIAKGANQFTLF